MCIAKRLGGFYRSRYTKKYRFLQNNNLKFSRYSSSFCLYPDDLIPVGRELPGKVLPVHFERLEAFGGGYHFVASVCGVDFVHCGHQALVLGTVGRIEQVPLDTAFGRDVRKDHARPLVGIAGPVDRAQDIRSRLDQLQRAVRGYGEFSRSDFRNIAAGSP